MMTEFFWCEIDKIISKVKGISFTHKKVERVSGGDINESYQILNNEICFFVKINSIDLKHMFEAESEGLDEIEKSKTILCPEVIAVGEIENKSFLILEYIKMTNSGSWSYAGERLAELHKFTNSRFGWHRENTIGTSLQLNKYEDDWITFFKKMRLGYQFALAKKNGLKLHDTEKLIENLDLFFNGYKPQASLLHGDLWSGNISFTDLGELVIYDPAVYFGDRETDLAMTELFGRFSSSFYESYHNKYPINEGYAKRKPIYQLYHILNHFNLFGGSYGVQSQNIINSLIE
jgi:fructosamine-3-kinase